MVVVAPQVPELEAPAPAPAEPEPEATVAAATSPALTLLRAEPDGSLVIAGTASPGAEVEVYANGEPLGTTTAEPSGDWVLVPEAPLAAGGVEITMGEAGGDRLAGQSYVVVIDPDRAAEPLVIATRPGEASAVLQGMPPPEIPSEEVAAAPEPEATEPMVEPAPEAPSRSAAEPPATSEPASVEEPETPDTSVATIEPEVAAPAPSPTLLTTIPPSIDAIEIDGTANFIAGGGAEGATVRLYVDDRFIADAKVAEGRWLVEADAVLTQPSQRVRVDMLKPGTAEVAARAEVNFVIELPAAAPEPEPVSQPEPVIVAERSDRELDPAADAATTPSPARDLAATPDASPATGVRRDLTVAADAEPTRPSDRDLGAAEKPAREAATTPDLAQPAREASHTEDRAIETADVPDAAVSTPKLLFPSTKPAVQVPRPEPVAEPRPEPAVTPQSGESPVRETSAPVPEPREAAEPAPVVQPRPAQEAAATPATPAVQAKPAAPATTTAAPAEPVPAAAPTTVAAFPPEEEPVPTLKAVPVGEPDAMRFASGKAIIRRGDNLWSIARRVYGDGLKYTTIYRANKDQIRSPSRIYPGQVFGLPLVYDE
ncbi:MAG: LysM peptidoglycan-binding domain-containing protein [Devosia sp.]